ncbi:hypothetical protein KR51_00016580 [Rubidibacter lacunae KORDI 51-2]|uniref:Uncharacterized protein n=1 Tax=Rubidibacter lacunae KORDI 51-2 TaxID=582515 RepID=U5DQ30_9CHRO|nr:hypothetical protein [Rubidibacter lacunae]ERN41805.1 hypothetical protein KR51_00016580 [Rubidibacter lacunae KORDI 51-2]
MNAAEQAYTPDLACKIAQTALTFKHEFPDAGVDFAPWLRDPDTQSSIDPNSIDLSFYFPRCKPDCQSRCVLVEIRFSGKLPNGTARMVGIEITSFDGRGQKWRFSTVGEWGFSGREIPTPCDRERLKRFCRSTFKLFQISVEPKQ